nr:neuropeptide-like 1 isoform X4 [Megalopta genalis]
MSLTRSYLVTFLFYVSIVNQIRLPLVRCQGEPSTQCVPKRDFVALSRLPEVRFYLSAYSRTARMIHSRNRNDITYLLALIDQVDDDTEICIPTRLYIELFRDPIMRGDFLGRMKKLPDISGRFMDDSEEIDTGVPLPSSQKRSIAMLAKNDDLPISLQDRLGENQDDEEKRTMVSSRPRYIDEPVPSSPRILPRPILDSEAFAPDYVIEKRQFGRSQFSSPNDENGDEGVLVPTAGKRNVASLARTYTLPQNGKRNVGVSSKDFQNLFSDSDVPVPSSPRILPRPILESEAFAPDYVIEKRHSGRSHLPSLDGENPGILPQNGKRNVGALARDYGLPHAKQNLGSLSRTGGDYPTRQYSKRSVSSLAKNRAWPITLKRGISVPTSVILRTISRQGRSLANLANIQDLASAALAQKDNYESDVYGDDKLNDSQTTDGLYERIDSANRRPNKQLSFSDEYPLPVMQNTNGFDYEEMMEALGDQYLNAEKRFMGSLPEMQPKVEQSQYPETFRASKRHIAAAARLGWLSSLRASRFSRSPRYLVSRENTADGSSSNASSASSTRSLRPHFEPGAPHVQALHGDCRHGFKRFRL